MTKYIAFSLTLALGFFSIARADDSQAQAVAKVDSLLDVSKDYTDAAMVKLAKVVLRENAVYVAKVAEELKFEKIYIANGFQISNFGFPEMWIDAWTQRSKDEIQKIIMSMLSIAETASQIFSPMNKAFAFDIARDSTYYILRHAAKLSETLAVLRKYPSQIKAVLDQKDIAAVKFSDLERNYGDSQYLHSFDVSKKNVCGFLSTITGMSSQNLQSDCDRLSAPDPQVVYSLDTARQRITEILHINPAFTDPATVEVIKHVLMKRAVEVASFCDLLEIKQINVDNAFNVDTAGIATLRLDASRYSKRNFAETEEVILNLISVGKKANAIFASAGIGFRIDDIPFTSDLSQEDRVLLTRNYFAKISAFLTQALKYNSMIVLNLQKKSVADVVFDDSDGDYINGSYSIRTFDMDDDKICHSFSYLIGLSQLHLQADCQKFQFKSVTSSTSEAATVVVSKVPSQSGTPLSAPALASPTPPVPAHVPEKPSFPSFKAREYVKYDSKHVCQTAYVGAFTDANDLAAHKQQFSDVIDQLSANQRIARTFPYEFYSYGDTKRESFKHPNPQTTKNLMNFDQMMEKSLLSIAARSFPKQTSWTKGPKTKDFPESSVDIQIDDQHHVQIEPYLCSEQADGVCLGLLVPTQSPSQVVWLVFKQRGQMLVAPFNRADLSSTMSKDHPAQAIQQLESFVVISGQAVPTCAAH